MAAGFLHLIASRPHPDQAELITVGSGGYGLARLALTQPRRGIFFRDGNDDVTDDRSGHNPNKDN